MAWNQVFRHGARLSAVLLPVAVPVTALSFTFNKRGAFASNSGTLEVEEKQVSGGLQASSSSPSPSSSSSASPPASQPSRANPHTWVHDALEGDGKIIRKALGVDASELKEGLEHLIVFSGSSNPSLAEEIAYELHTKLGRITREIFADGETSLHAQDSVRGKDVYIVQSTSSPVNENLMELCFMISLMRRASARTITAIIPYYGYKRDVGTASSLTHAIRYSGGGIVGGTGGSIEGDDIGMNESSSASSSLSSSTVGGGGGKNGNNSLITSVNSKNKFTSMPYFSDSRLAAAAAAASTNNDAIPVSAADVARMLETVGVDRVLTIELQPPGTGNIEGFFSPHVPVESLRATAISVDFISRLKLRNPVVVAPNESCIQLAYDMRTGLQKRLGTNVGIAAIMQAGPSRGSDRYAHALGRTPLLSGGSSSSGNSHYNNNGVDAMELVGDVKGADVVICDDMIDTAKTLMTRIQLLKDRGAQRVVAYATHGLFTGAALQRINRSPLSDVVVTNTIPLREDVNTRDTHKIVQLSVAPLIAEAILRVQMGQSLQDLRIFDRESAEPRYKGQE